MCIRDSACPVEGEGNPGTVLRSSAKEGLFVACGEGALEVLEIDVYKRQAQGHDLILEIDVQGCLQAMEQDSEVTGIVVSPPSRENLEKRCLLYTSRCV